MKRECSFVLIDVLVTGLHSHFPVSLSATSSREGGVLRGASSSENASSSYMHNMNDNDPDQTHHDMRHEIMQNTPLLPILAVEIDSTSMSTRWHISIRKREPQRCRYCFRCLLLVRECNLLDPKRAPGDFERFEAPGGY